MIQHLCSVKSFAQYLIIGILAASCGGGGGASAGPSTPAVNGTNATGTYFLNNVQCYNSSLTTLTHATTYVAPHSDQVIVTR